MGQDMRFWQEEENLRDIGRLRRLEVAVREALARFDSGEDSEVGFVASVRVALTGSVTRDG